MSVRRGCYLLQYILITKAIILVHCVACQGSPDPCDDSENVIQLPGDRKCLSYYNDAKHWVEAASICERNGGSLYRMEGGELRAGSSLKQCLLSTPDTGGRMDFWIGATSVWSPQWTWVNGTYINPLLACTRNYGALPQPSFDVCSQHLSVDYCVSVCRQEGAPFSVIQQKSHNRHPCCWCSFQLDQDEDALGLCPFSNYSRGGSEYLFIFTSISRIGTAIILKSSEALAQTETLCARVNLETTTVRELSSQSCFTQNYYLCDLGYQSGNCTLRLKGRCVHVGQEWVTWFSARADCRRRLGDLLVVGELVDLYEIIPYIKLRRSYWIGAYNHFWNFAPESDVFSSLANYIPQETTCGHMYNQDDTWRWADSRCDARKPFYCQFDSVRYANVPDGEEEIICPWNIVLPSIRPTEPPRHTQTHIGNGTATSMPTPGPIIKEKAGSFPVAAVVAGLVAAMLILLCLLLTAIYTRRRRWFAKRFSRTSKSNRVFGGQRVPTRLYRRWSNGYGYYPDHFSDGGWESLSTHYTGDVSVVSAPSPLREGYESHGLTRAYTLASPSDLDALYARVNKKSGIIRRSTTKGAAHNFSTVGPAVGSAITATSGIGSTIDASEHDLDKTMTSLHQSESTNSKQYMTLAAHMDILEDMGSTISFSRGRPEVALVTNDVDLNFTVNHAITKSRVGSDHSSERTLDEIALPLGTTMEIPTREADAVLY